MTSPLICWRKSSYSDNGGLNCVEVGAWRKSSRSTENGSCLEVGTWHKSNHSGNNGGDCVEVADLAPVIAVRDSKNPDGAKLALSGRAWAAFTSRLKG